MKKNLIIALLSIALVISSYYLYTFSNDTNTSKETTNSSKNFLASDYLDPVSMSNSHDNIDDFRRNYRLDSTNGVYYNAEVIKYYIDSIYPNLIARMRPNDPGYSWKVGFYCMRRVVDGQRRLDYLVMPLRVHDASKRVTDFYSDSTAYRLRTDTLLDKINLACQTCPGYDAGQLWP